MTIFPDTITETDAEFWADGGQHVSGVATYDLHWYPSEDARIGWECRAELDSLSIGALILNREQVALICTNAVLECAETQIADSAEMQYKAGDYAA